MTHIYAIYKNPSQNKRSTLTQSEGIEKHIPSKLHEKKADVAIFISDKIDFKTKVIKRDKGRHYIIFKGTNHQEDIILISIS